MKKLTLVLGLLLFTFSFAFSQVTLQKIKIKKNSGTSSVPVYTYYQDRTYTFAQTDTTEFVSFGDCDSVQFFFSSTDSAWVHFNVLYGDGVKSSVITTTHPDTLKNGNTQGSFGSITWAKMIPYTGGSLFGARLVVEFWTLATGTTYNIGASPTTKTYSIYVRKFKKLP